MLYLKWVDKLNKALRIFIGILLGLMTIIIFFQVLVRAVFVNLSAPWTEELSRYLMIWLIFVGGGLATRASKLIAVEALVFGLPEKFGKALKISAHLAAISFYCILLFIGIEFFKLTSHETAPVMKVSMSFVYVSMIVGSAIMLINTIALIVDTIVNKLNILEIKEDIDAGLND